MVTVNDEGLPASGSRGGEAMLAGGELNKLLNVFRAAAAAAGFFQAELGLELAGHHYTGPACFPDI